MGFKDLQRFANIISTLGFSLQIWDLKLKIENIREFLFDSFSLQIWDLKAFLNNISKIQSQVLASKYGI